ncbi:DUF6062 family protein [Sphaerochaeta globosa]|uniref:Uncharacterized protein n=1 Tax=Sphaerochaeta globosa (strain ATCC BAA-1886 / DSM 22777 / Buddy) TaxID=158189 RepID=F0RZK4_SPHGB|nr:DUF6062 family protein [Sphaerochaeta globosa]ADY14755.1 hypothetical protein SpiBuddy_2948 [Sphaerochaeta globosa str. Buddy]
MKLELETIPVWDGVASQSECFLCDLMAEAQKDGLSFYLGNSVMNPETRVKVNEHGFCTKHWQLLAAANKPQGVALMADTYLGMTRSKAEKSINNLLGTKTPRGAKKAIQAFKQEMEAREKGCLVCSAMQQRLDRYVFTTCYLWGEDEAFRQALQEGKGFCLHHFQLLLEKAPTVLSSSLVASFVHDLTQTEVFNLDRIAKDVYWMTQKYKSENMDKPWNGCEDAHKRSVDKMTGRHRVIDPV